MLGLPTLGLDLFASPPPVAPDYSSIVGTPTAPSGGFTGSVGGGGMGLGAYGFTGASGTKGTKGSAKYGFQPEMWAALSRANAAMVADGLPAFRITDGWRSYGAQVDVRKRKPNLAATPGRSVHGIGLAADLALNAKQKKWLEANAARFGLARLPSEDWHYQLLPQAFGRSVTGGAAPRTPTRATTPRTRTPIPTVPRLGQVIR